MNTTLPNRIRTNAEPVRALRARTRYAGENQYALAVMFRGALSGKSLDDRGGVPVVGDPRLGPRHVMDGLVRDYALLPEHLTCMTQPMGVCRVLDYLPACEECGQNARYDMWATPWQLPVLLCEECAAPAEGAVLGLGAVTCLLTFGELHWTIRDICDRVTDELGRPSLFGSVGA